MYIYIYGAKMVYKPIFRSESCSEQKERRAADVNQRQLLLDTINGGNRSINGPHKG